MGLIALLVSLGGVIASLVPRNRRPNQTLAANIGFEGVGSVGVESMEVFPTVDEQVDRAAPQTDRAHHRSDGR